MVTHSCWRITGALLMTVTLNATTSGSVLPQTKTVTSNTAVVLNSAVFDSATGTDVSLIGLLHVQTKVDPSTGLVEGEVNIQEGLFLAALQTIPGPPDPRRQQLSELQELIGALKSQIAAVYVQILKVQQELAEELNTGPLSPHIPGIPRIVDRERVAELHDELNRLGDQFNELRRQLAAALDELEALIGDVKRRPVEAFVLYTAAGASAIAPSTCALSGPACEKFVNLSLLRSDGTSLPFQVRLTLSFTAQGTLVLALADHACVITTCSGDTGECTCSSESTQRMPS